jgi:hypothetical protein
MGGALIRDAEGRYRSADGRFSVEREGTSWYLRDSRQPDELGLPRILGPYPTLDAAREAIAEAPAAPPTARARKRTSTR